MNFDTLRSYCLAKAATSEDFPFDEQTLVFRVHQKIFALLSLDESPLRINLKCDPERAVELREKHACVLPGYHMNKRHWNTVVLDGSVSSKVLCEWLDHSYELVLRSVPKRVREGR